MEIDVLSSWKVKFVYFIRIVRMESDTVIMGLGNVLMGDEGIGVHSVEYLRDKEIPENVDLIDGGTGGFHLLSLFNQYDHLILIDATISDSAPGEVKILRPRFASDFPRSLTSHDIGLKDLVQTAELLDKLPDIHLVTISIKDLRNVGIGISDSLEDSLDEVYRAVLEILSKAES
jgi:hydrogenase maturation protease